jgi:hypothetical protein
VEVAHAQKSGGDGACADTWWRWRRRKKLLEVAHALKHGGGDACTEIWRRRRMCWSLVKIVLAQ